MPNIESLTGLLINDTIADVIDMLEYNKHDMAKCLYNLALAFPDHVFGGRAAYSEEVNDGLTKYSLEYSIMHTVFCRLLQLPVSIHSSIYYFAASMEIVKLAPKRFVPVLGKFIRSFFALVPICDGELIFRFIDWMSQQLSNFNFSYKWEEWIPILSQSTYHPQLVFIREVIQREVALSYSQRIKHTLPEPYHVLVAEPEFELLLHQQKGTC